VINNQCSPRFFRSNFGSQDTKDQCLSPVDPGGLSIKRGTITVFIHGRPQNISFSYVLSQEVPGAELHHYEGVN
jgi:hypothetical protein